MGYLFICILLYALLFACMAYGLLSLYKTTGLSNITNIAFWGLSVFVFFFMLSENPTTYPLWIFIRWVVLMAALILYAATYYLVRRHLVKKHPDMYDIPLHQTKLFLKTAAVFTFAALFDWWAFCLLPAY